MKNQNIDYGLFQNVATFLKLVIKNNVIEILNMYEYEKQVKTKNKKGWMEILPRF